MKSNGIELKDKQTVGISVEVVTPSVASGWLGNNEKNRPICKSRIANFASQMDQDMWIVNGEAIKLDKHGAIIDGQHRLVACVKSGKPFKTFVMRGFVHDDIFDSLDSGGNRTASDVLAMVGEKSTHQLAGAIRVVGSYLRGFPASRGAFTLKDVQNILNENPGLRRSVQVAGKLGAGIVRGTLLTGYHYLFSLKDEALADTFARQLASGADLSSGDPVLALRSRLIKNKLKDEKLPERIIIQFLIKAWNYTRKGKRLTLLRYSDGDNHIIM